MTPQQLFEENQSFAMWMANKYKGYENFDDLKQLALIGLYDAALRFDTSYGVRFTTYAHYFIHKEILRHVEKWKSVHVPRQIVEYARVVKRIDYENMTVEQIANETDIPLKQIKRVLDYINLSVAPIDGPAYSHDNSISLAETIPQAEDDWDDSILFKDFVKSLDDRENTIVMMRLDGKSQREIAEVLGVSQVQVSRLLVRIKNKFTSFTE